MGSGCVTNLVDGFHSHVYCCIKSNRIFSTRIQVDGSRKSYCVDSLCGQLLCSAEGTVSADNYQTVNAFFTADIRCFLLIFFLFKLLTSCGKEYGTTSGDDIPCKSSVHVKNLTVEQTAVSTFNALYFHASVPCGSRNSSDRRIHTGCVSSTC